MGKRSSAGLIATAVLLTISPRLARAVDPNPLENAYWRFEEGTPGNTVDPNNANAVTDSANANHMRTSSDGNSAPAYNATVSAPIVPQTGLSNAVSMRFAGGNKDIYSELKHINHPIITNGFTLEASFNLDSVGGGAFQCIVGKDGRPSASSPVGTLELKCRGDDGTLQIELIDGSGTPQQVRSANSLAAGTWYHTAVVDTGSTLSLYLDSGDGNGYVLQGQTAISGALADIDRPWTIGRGTFNDANTDWMAGTVEEVRLSNTSLDPSKFLFVPASSRWNVDADGANWSSLSSWTDGGSPRVAGAAANLTDAITAPRTINVDVPVTLGTLIFDNANAYTLAGSIPLTFDQPSPSSSALISAINGTHTIRMNVALAKDATVTVVQPGATLTLGGGVTSAPGLTLTKQGPGTLAAKNIRGGGNLLINAGVVRIPNDGSAAGVSVIDSLSIGGGGTPRLDVTNNKLVTKSAIGNWNGTAYDGVTGQIASGRNGGGWNGSGIVTSAAAGNFTTLAVASAQQVKGLANPTDTAAWAGQTVTGSDTLVMFTYGGDANLDGKINVDDYGRIDSSAPLGIAGWYNGDFNYDGKINVDDYGIIDFNVGIQGAPFPTGGPVSPGPSALSSVPEPTHLSLIVLPAIFRFAGRRLRHALAGSPQ